MDKIIFWKNLGRRATCITAVSVVGLASFLSSAANASQSNDDSHLLGQDGIENALQNIATVENELIAPTVELEQSSTLSEFSAVTEGSSSKITVPLDINDPIVLQSSIGQDVSIGLPSEGDESEGMITETGHVAYPSGGGITNVAGPTADGLQMFSIIAGADSPEQIVYDLSLPAGATIETAEVEDGFVVLDAQGGFILAIAAPWARDANGKNIATSYTLDGSKLIQNVDHAGRADITYPVVADPHMGIDLIKSHKWVYSKKDKGYTISVAVTPWMGFVGNNIAKVNGWKELKNKVANKKRLDTGTMIQQWYCHGEGKIFIGLGDWLGIDKRPTWDLETWRPKNPGFLKMVTKKCNW